jgi:Tfp pilus assembly protein PilZ
MERSDSRLQTRYRVHLSVRFETALDFVTEYAENLSRGGLFVRGAHHLELNREVPIQMEVDVLGVVVSHSSEMEYARAGGVLDKTDFVYGIDCLEEVDELLPVCDEML